MELFVVGDYQTLKNIIEQSLLTALFQPIYDTEQAQLYGYEALIRGPSNSPLHSPIALFDSAVEHGLLSELELICRQVSIETFAKLGLQGKLFLNVSPMVFLQDDHPKGATLSFLEQYGVAPEKVVIELSERYVVNDPELLAQALLYYRELGFKVAIDDLGSGYAGLKLWSEILPDFVKVDRHFISNIDKDSVKREFVKSILALGANINSKVILEGIETEQEFYQLQELGASLGQGYLLGRPELLPVKILPSVLTTHQRKVKYGNYLDKLASSVFQHAVSFDSQTKTGAIVDYFTQHKHLHSLPIVQDQIPVGMALREEVLELFASPYGRALHEKKPIIDMLSSQPVVVEADTKLDEVAKLVTSVHDEQLLWHFIITEQGRYIGIGSVRDLLKQLTEQQLQQASYANPLTQLPGNVPIYQKIDDLLSKQQVFHFAYFDLNNFKPFNDVYGYAKGDSVIRLLADILQSYCTAEDFIGHIGGDDFIAIFVSDNWQQKADSICQHFDQAIRSYYTQEDLNQGGIVSPSRSGELQKYPILSVAVAVVEPDVERCRSHHDIAELASSAKKEAKKRCKELGKSAVYLCQRRGPDGL